METHYENPKDAAVTQSNSLLGYLINHYTLIFLAITLISCGYKVIVHSSPLCEAFLKSFLTWNIGVRGFVAFIANWVSPFAEQIAESYGWPSKTSFQREAAATEGAFALLGILCNWIQGDFWTATVIGVSFCWFFSELGSLMLVKQLKKDPAYCLHASLQRGMRIDCIFSILLPICLILWKMGY